MGLSLILRKPDGTVFDELTLNHMRHPTLLHELILPGMVGPGPEWKLIAAELAAYATVYRNFLSGFRWDHPPFPREALLQFTELGGEHWAQMVLEAEALYEADAPEFDAAIEEIIAAVQFDMEEEHRIPYNKHRYFDTLLCFKAEINDAVYRRGPDDLTLTWWEYDYVAHRAGILARAVDLGCVGEWSL